MPDRGAIPARTTADPWRSALRGLGGGLAAALLSSFALNLLMLAVPLYSQQLFDRVLGSGHVETLVLLSLVTGLALATLGLFEMVRASLLARTASRFEQVLARPVVEAAARRGGPASSGLRDLAQLRAALTGPAATALFDAPWLPAALLGVWILHPRLAALTAASAATLTLLAVLNDLLTRPPQRRAGRAQLEAQELADALARKAEAARAMGMVDALADRIGRLHGASLAAQQSAAERGGVVMGLTRAVRLAVQSGVMGLGAWLVLGDQLTPGAMLAASILVSKALAPVEQMVGAWRTVNSGRESWARLREVLAGDGRSADCVDLPAPLGRLTVEDVDVRTADGRALLHGLTFALERGECLAVVGPSGAGKSTLCRLLTGVVAPDAGSVRLDAASLAHYPPAALGRHVGYLPQEAMLFAGTVAENVARMAPAAEGRDVVRAAQHAGAHEMVLRLPDGYATRLADGGAPLSGGQRQRIGLARALFGEPRLVVLDEPNANLDAEGEAALMATIGRLKEAGATVVVVTHRPQALRQADRVLVLERGGVARFGPRDAVLRAFPGPVRAA
jgi:ATP-binding cassette subfamily C protein/ATP-binding cassette subfamily C exporter for protease/lipase/ATP-binding cassette subfamily C protein EexD